MRKGSPGWAVGVCQSRPRSSPRTLWSGHAATGTPHPSGGPAHPQSQSLGLGGHHALILSSEAREVGGQGAGFLSLLQPTHPPSIGAGKQGQGPWKSKPR